MTAVPRLLAFAGSLREGSFNRRLIPVLADGARAAGAVVTLIELRDYPLPACDGDIGAASMPPPVRELQQLLREHDGLLISTPESNGSMPTLVKNTLDWISRPMEDGTMGAALFQGKVAGIVAASPGALGGLRSLLVLRDVLTRLGVVVVPQQVAVGQAADKFVDYGQLKDDKQRAAVQAVGAAVTRLTAARLAVSA